MQSPAMEWLRSAEISDGKAEQGSAQQWRGEDEQRNAGASNGEAKSSVAENCNGSEQRRKAMEVRGMDRSARLWLSGVVRRRDVRCDGYAKQGTALLRKGADVLSRASKGNGKAK